MPRGSLAAMWCLTGQVCLLPVPRTSICRLPSGSDVHLRHENILFGALDDAFGPVIRRFPR